jgi:hypothetical protein
MQGTLEMRRPTSYRAVGWLAVAGLVAGALVGPTAGNASATSLPSAIWTSLSDGSSVNSNIYALRTDVYLNGGPQGCTTGGDGLPNGDYYFEVTDTSASTLLSADAIKFRQVKVVGGKIDGVSGAGNHAVGNDTSCGTHPVQLATYGNSSNGEYKVLIAPVAEVASCTGYSADSTTFNFTQSCNASTKSDNFKVGPAAASTPPSAPPSTPPSAPPSTAPSTPPSAPPSTAPSTPPSAPPSTPPSNPPSTPPSTAPTEAPTGGVLAETGTPGTTPPPTDTFSTGSSNDGGRVILLTIAGLIGLALILTPAPGSRRRR